MARLDYTTFEDKAFRAVGKPTINVMKMLAHSSATIEAWCDIGAAQFARLALSKKMRELVILLSSAKFESAYEWTHHIVLSSRLGITDWQKSELAAAGKVKAYFSSDYWEQKNLGFDEQKRALLQFLEAVIDTGEVHDELWQKTKAKFSPREIVEIISMQGFYYTFSRVTTVLKVDIDKQSESKL